MTSDRESQFDDPALKAALKRAVGGEGAPPQLRARVERALAAEAASPASSAPARPARRAFDWRRSPLIGLAAAALIIVSFFIIYDQGTQYFDTGPTVFIPEGFYKDMIATHEGALALAAKHQLDVPVDDLSAIRQTLKDKLGHPVLVASLGPQWKLQGARVTKVGDTPAAQLVYTKGSETVSVFSLKGDAYQGYAPPPDGTEYRATVNGHPIAGVFKAGAVHCIVGSKDSELSEKDLARLSEQVEKEISLNHSGEGCGGDEGGIRPPMRPVVTAGM